MAESGRSTHQARSFAELKSAAEKGLSQRHETLSSRRPQAFDIPTQVQESRPASRVATRYRANCFGDKRPRSSLCLLRPVLVAKRESHSVESGASRRIFPMPPFSPSTCASAASHNGIRRPIGRTNLPSVLMQHHCLHRVSPTSSDF